MFKKLAATKLVKYQRHRGVNLTPKGEEIALQIIRRHRLIESFLVEVLGFSWDEVHLEADRLEHVMSEKLESRIAALLDDPPFDPHGDPIPGTDNVTSKLQKGVPLTHLEVGHKAMINRVSDEDPELLRYLGQLDLTPRERVEVIDRGPFGGPVHVRVMATGVTHPLSRLVTDQIFVAPESQNPSGSNTDA
jgi:DtxR family Mn-dependent transcriptional regulator